MSSLQLWLLVFLLAFSLGCLGICLWLSSSVLAVLTRKRGRLIVGGLALVGLILSGWVPGLALLRRLEAHPERRLTAGELCLLGYLNLGLVTGLAMLAFGRQRAPRPIPFTRETDLGLGTRLLSLHSDRKAGSVCPLIPFNQVYQVVQRDWEVPFRDPPLPPDLDGFTILHISDIHLGSYLVPEFFQEIGSHLSQLEWDILVLSGDFLAPSGSAADLTAWLGGFARKGKAFAVLGNHDFFDHPVEEVTESLSRSGVVHLGGKAVEIQRGSAKVGLAGLDYQNWWKPFPLLELRKQISPGAFPILVTHTPCPFPEARKVGFALVLCGHTHGGQIRLGGLGAPFIPARYGRRYQMGLYREGSSYLHVHPGIGGPPPVRLNCPPEITRLVLTAPSGGNSSIPHNNR